MAYFSNWRETEEIMKINEVIGKDDVGQKIYKDNKTRVVHNPVADKNISIGDQRMAQAGARMKRDMANAKAGGEQVWVDQKSRDAVAKADKNIANAYSKQDKIDQRQGAGQSFIKKGKPVRFDKSNSSSNIKLALD